MSDQDSTERIVISVEPVNEALVKVAEIMPLDRYTSSGKQLYLTRFHEYRVSMHPGYPQTMNFTGPLHKP